jgi:undecaprenyl-diphosphatase
MSTIGSLGASAARYGMPLLRRTVRNLASWAAALFQPTRGRALHWQSTVGLAGLIIVAVPVVVAAMLLVDSSAIALQRFLPDWLVAGFDEITDYGKSGWILFPVGALLVACAATASPALGRMTRLVLLSVVVRFGFVFTAVGLTGAAVAIVKRLIGRARPIHFSPEGPFAFLPFGWSVDWASLPSGHSTTAFSTLVAFGALYPRARALLWTFAVVIAVSRVAIAAHYPSDVIAGAVFGAVGALIVRNWFATRRLGFTVAPDGSVLARPGPSWRRFKRLIGQITP